MFSLNDVISGKYVMTDLDRYILLQMLLYRTKKETKEKLLSLELQNFQWLKPSPVYDNFVFKSRIGCQYRGNAYKQDINFLRKELLKLFK